VTDSLFHCPACGGDRAFRLRRPRAWFRLVGIAIVPVGRGGPLVECRACAARFSPVVLDVPTAVRLEELVWRGTRTAAAFVLTGLLAGPSAHRGVDDARVALDVLRRVLGPDYGPEVLSADLAAHREGSDLGVLEHLAPHLSMPGREGLLRGLADLVLALHRSGGPDWSRLENVAAALGVPPTHVRGIVEEASARARE
jgi:hypothetical protein